MKRRTILLSLISTCTLITLPGCGDDAVTANGTPAAAVPLTKFTDAVPPQVAAGAIAPGGKCNMETVNGVHWGTTVHGVDRAEPIRIAGWGVVDAANKIAAESTYVRLLSTDGKSQQFALATQTVRPDVGKYFSDPWLNGSGYEINAEVGALPAGDYAATLVMIRGANATLCDSGRRLTVR